MTNLFTYLSNGKLKYICALVVLLCLGVGNVWGETETRTATLNFTTDGGTNSGNLKDTVCYFSSSTAGFSGSVTNIVNISTAQNSASTAPTIYADGLRIYKKKSNSNGGSITLAAGSDVVNITGVTITAVSSTYVRTTSYKVDGGSASSVSWSSTTGSISSIKASTSVYIQVTENTNNTNQLRISQIVMTYTAEKAAACEENPTIGAASLNGSFF